MSNGSKTRSDGIMVLEDRELSKRRCTVVVFGLLIAALLLGCASAGETAVQTFDFSEVSASGLPVGWAVVSYENEYDVSCEAGTVAISTEIADDCRLVHTVPVSGNTKYILSAEMMTEDVIGGQGATLSVDNYGVDGSYIYSESVYGTKEWTRIELPFQTDRLQSSVQLALRIGGYSNQTSGTVRFRNVTFAQSDAASAYQRLTVRDKAAQENDKSTEQYAAYFSLIFWETIFAAAFLLYGVYLHRDRFEKLRMSTLRRNLTFVLIVLAGLVIRLILCAVQKGHATDMGCWVAWGNQIADGNFATFYDGTWYDYPPGYMYLLGGLTLVMRLFNVSAWQSETLRLFWYMLPAFLCDIGCGVLVMRFAKEQNRSDGIALLLGALVVLNPAVMYLSGAWGQIDSILTFLLLLAFDAFRKDRRILCGIWYALAILVKWQALIYGPVIAAVYLATLFTEKDAGRRRKGILHTILAVLIALLIIFAASLPFRGSMSLFWIAERFLSASSGYDYATVEGYNFFALLGANWVKADTDVFQNADFFGALAQTFSLLGKLLLPAAGVTLTVFAWREFREKTGHAAQVSLLFTALSSGIVAIFAVLIPEMESFVWAILAVAAAIGVVGWLLQAAQEKGLRAFFAEQELAFELVAVSASAAGFAVSLLLVRTVLRLFGVVLSFKAVGTCMILFAVAALVWMLIRYAKRNRLHSSTPELLYLCAAVFMTIVFTFGQYMHERYVFPVLILLLFVYAATEDRKMLLFAILLTLTAFLNEMVAMYVVSDGAIHAIRGGERHTLFLQICSAGEVLTALYLMIHTAGRLIRAKGGDASCKND